jgi:crotonobetainyl-CoA:carnitine CoA-transferase CaiB-like acyl-CoA transferase
VVVLTLFRDNPLQLLCRAFGVEDMSKQPKFADVERQIANKADIQAVFAPLFAQHTTAEVLERLGQVDILCSPVNDLSAVIDHPQTQANEAVWTIDVPGRGKVKVAGNAVRLSRTPAEYRLPPAWMGAHNAEVLRSFGFGEAEIQRLQATGILSEDARLQQAAE